MIFKITDVKTKEVLHEIPVHSFCTLHNLVRQWAFDNATPVDLRDENTPGTADIDASLIKSDNNMGIEFDREKTISYFYL